MYRDAVAEIVRREAKKSKRDLGSVSLIELIDRDETPSDLHAVLWPSIGGQTSVLAQNSLFRKTLTGQIQAVTTAFKAVALPNIGQVENRLYQIAPPIDIEDSRNSKGLVMSAPGASATTLWVEGSVGLLPGLKKSYERSTTGNIDETETPEQVMDRTWQLVKWFVEDWNLEDR